VSGHQPAGTLGEMDDSSLPTDTMLDGPERDPEIDNEVAALLKAIYLAQPRIAAFRERGMSDTEIVDAMHKLVRAGFLKIVEHDGQIGVVPTEAGAAAVELDAPFGRGSLRKQKATAKRRLRRRLVGR
jgi:hypothetical protein